MAKYVLASQLAREAGTSGAYLSQTLMSHGIMPVSGPKADGGKQYVFRRADVEKLNFAGLVSEARHQEKRRNKKIEVIKSGLAEKILGINARELSQLVDCGVLDPSRTKQLSGESEYLFNLFHVERLKDSSIEYLNLISLPKAAKLLGETYFALRTNWVKSRHLKVACRYNDKIYLILTDVRAVLKLKEKALTINEAAMALNVSPKVVMGFVSSGRLKLVRKSSPTEDGRNLFWRKDIEKLCKRTSP